MDTKKRYRTVLRTTFTKVSRELEQLIGASQPDAREVQVNWELVQQKFDLLRVADDAVCDALLAETASEEDLEKEIDSCDVYRKKFTNLKFEVEELLQRAATDGDEPAPSGAASAVSAGNANDSGSAVGVTGRRKFKLPKIEFKKYDGSIRDWLPFWSQFKKIHEDTDIDASDKVQYLIQSTVEGSRARQVVESFPAVGDNYDSIVEALKSRFGREDLQIEVHVRELLSIIMNNAICKRKPDLSTLYDRVATQMRALETLGVASDKCSAMLFPLIESCLPQELLRAWQRSRAAEKSSSSSSLESRLKSLMRFMRSEVENEERITLATGGFGLHANVTECPEKAKKQKSSGSVLPTAAGLMNCNASNKCLFCEGTHATDACFKARNLSLEQKRKVLSDNNACFKCLKIGHRAGRCRGRLQCVGCGKSHVSLMCSELAAKQSSVTEISVGTNETKDGKKNVEQSLANSSGPQVFLQTLKVTIRSVRGSRKIRVLIDSGSERSYILKSTALELDYIPKKSETIVHGLFGGSKMEQKHCCYDVRLQNGDYACKFEVFDQPAICTNVASVFCGPWMQELQALNIKVNDTGDSSPIELLIGADVAGKLYTGRRKILKCGLVAMETLLGWTLMGKIPGERQDDSNSVMSALSLLLVDASVTDLWKLDVLGITDPIETKTRRDREAAAKDLFSQTIRVNEEGRYEVRLPWVDGHPPLPNNYAIARRRLEGTVGKLKDNGLFYDYDAIFQEWLREGIIEQVFEESRELCHYLPHRPVIKENSITTRIRPVFDASAREKDKPSINLCLEKGPNLIELILSILLRFRFHKVGVVADIRKAFLQISIYETDRNFLRFLWIDAEGHLLIYRHRRVVFGINSSPFLLESTIEHHLLQCLEKCEASNDLYSRETILKLLRSFYVDNCVTSVPDGDCLEQFVRESVNVLAAAKFDLRGWESPYFPDRSKSVTPVLGLNWSLDSDVLKINEDCLRDLAVVENKPLTKRLILSIAQRIFDPIGFCCPATLKPKLLLQEIWEQKTGWDTSVSEDCREKFLSWVKELPHLLNIEIPRWIGVEAECSLSIHTFCDASACAYSAVVFLRVQKGVAVNIHLLAAKSRVAPLGKPTIPRLELLAALIGARLFKAVRDNLEGEISCVFWTDSSTVLSWIRRREEWATFVRNRVAEIRELTVDGMWRHVPGILNPADLPSRGCSPKQLSQGKWWEGPDWLYDPENCWPSEDLEYNEDEIAKERKKKVVNSLFSGNSDEWHLGYFSKYSKILRMISWILRFSHNLRNPESKRTGVLTAEELDAAEMFVVEIVQAESFDDEGDGRLRTLDSFRDNYGVVRLRTRIAMREDSDSFRFPIVLPANHEVVDRLIRYTHEQSCHVGTGGLLSILRERFWILGGRRTIRRVLSKCTICKRQNSKRCAVPEAPLPRDRVRDAVAFEVTGVDFAGPLYLKTGSKVWVCLFSCAIYRCVHLELTSSLSTNGFLQVLRRFVSRRGRPRKIYSDNGTNFVGTENALERLDWERIKEETAVQRIIWRFNPPSAPWWGGFWERLIGLVKQLMRKVLGKASLDFEDLLTLVCECEAIVNSRPLTYLSDDPRELVALTPAMFLHDQVECSMPDVDAVEAASLPKKVLHKQKLRDVLRKRFRNEYLGQLKLLNKTGPLQSLSVDDVVLIGNENSKRLDWPMGRVMELIPGADGKVRLARVQTSKGHLVRPLQRLYPVECVRESAGVPEGNLESRVPVMSAGESESESERNAKSAGVSEGNLESRAPTRSARVSATKTPMTITRSGRVSRPPSRYY